MKLTLIRPNIGHIGKAPYLDEGRMEPLGLGVLAAMCPPDVDVSIVDDRCEPIDYDAPTDLVGITVEVFTARRAYEISAEFRGRGVKVVMGGFHVTLIPEEAAPHADAIVLGDAEGVWLAVIEDARAGRLRPVYRADAPCEIQARKLPRRDLFRGKGYLPITLVQYGRGCPNRCAFCAVSAFFKQKHTHRDVDEVVREIENQDRKLIFFVDDNIVGDKAAAKKLFRALIPLKIRWVSQGSIDMTHDPELMALLCESGCVGNVIGFESIDPEALKSYKAVPNLKFSGEYEHEIETLKQYGLQTWAALTIGYDTDTPESLRRLLDFALRNKFTFAAFNVLMPYPNTPFYDKLKAQGRLLYDGRWWLHPNYRFYQAAFRPAKMSADELTEIGFELRTKFNSPLSVLRRFLDPRTNMSTLYRMGVYWTYNPLFRREVFRKIGMNLGGARRLAGEVDT